MEEHGNLDGSGGYIFESVCSHVGGNVIKGAIVGGFFGAAKFRLDNPRNALPQNSPGEMLPEGGSGTTRVGRWMSQDEYAKMIETGKVQMSPNGNTAYVANPADINAFGSQAKPGSIYVEFDVDSSALYQAGSEGWGQIPGPGSLFDRLNIKKGLPPIEDIPNVYNIKIGGKK